MPNVLTISRAGVLLADGALAQCEGAPRGEGTHLADVVAVINALQVRVFDRTTKKTAWQFTVSRQHSDAAHALNHHFMEPQNASGVATLVFGFDDGTTLHTWSLVNAHWEPVKPAADCIGVRTRMTYQVTGGRLAYAGIEGGLTDDLDGDGDLIDDAP